MSKVRFRDAPHPLREFLAMLVVSILAVIALTSFTQGRALRLAMVCMGVAAVLVGLALISNLNGAADFYSAISKRKTRFGVDYSDYVLLEPRFVRIIGGTVFVLFGIFFAASAATGPM